MAELEAVNVTVWGAAAVTLKGEAGEAVSPAGRPEIVMETVPENPFRAVIEICTFVELPAVTVNCELTWMLKSGGGGGGGGGDWLALPPPQPEESSRTKLKRYKKSKRARSEDLAGGVRWWFTRTLP